MAFGNSIITGRIIFPEMPCGREPISMVICRIIIARVPRKSVGMEPGGCKDSTVAEVRGIFGDATKCHSQVERERER